MLVFRGETFLYQNLEPHQIEPTKRVPRVSGLIWRGMRLLLHVTKLWRGGLTPLSNDGWFQILKRLVVDSTCYPGFVMSTYFLFHSSPMHIDVFGHYGWTWYFFIIVLYRSWTQPKFRRKKDETYWMFYVETDQRWKNNFLKQLMAIAPCVLKHVPAHVWRCLCITSCCFDILTNELSLHLGGVWLLSPYTGNLLIFVEAVSPTAN